MATGDAGYCRCGKCWLRLSAPAIVAEVRVPQVNTGSLTESTQQSGFSHAIPRIALDAAVVWMPHRHVLMAGKGFDPKRPMPPVIASGDSTLYNLSLPNNRNDSAERSADRYLANVSGKLTITPETVNHALSSEDMVATWPADTKEGWWRYRPKAGRCCATLSRVEPLKAAGRRSQIQAFYEKWYTPDAMTLIVAGNITRSVAEQINKTFGTLKGKARNARPGADASPLRAESVSI